MTWNKLCQWIELSDVSGKEFLVEGHVIAVFKRGEQLFALDGMCAHQGGPIAQGEVDQNFVTCPWHGWQYDLASGCNLLTGKKLLQTYIIENRAGEVWIEV